VRKTSYIVTARREHRFEDAAEALGWAGEMAAQGFNIGVESYTMEDCLQPLTYQQTVELPLTIPAGETTAYHADQMPAPAAAPALTEAEVRDLFTAWAQREGIVAAKALLEKHGVQRFSDLTAEQLPAFASELA
jgi:hypothetical protein